MKEMISATLYTLRVTNRLTSKEMASRLGISQAQYSKIETGVKEVSLQKLKEIAAVFNIELNTLLELILKKDHTANRQAQTAPPKTSDV